MKSNREVSNTFYNRQSKSPGLSKWFRLQGELMTVDALSICLCIFFLFYWGAAKTISVLGYRQSQVHFDNQKVLSQYWVTKHLLLWVQALLHLCQKFLQLTPFLDITGAMQPFLLIIILSEWIFSLPPDELKNGTNYWSLAALLLCKKERANTGISEKI